MSAGVIDSVMFVMASSRTFQAVRGRGFPSGKDRSGTWVSIGPSEAVYPFFGPRNSGLYVPNEYSAASRINAMAIGPICAPRHCTLWVAAAGGGIWRTDDALANTVKWTYLSGGFGINAIGSITVDWERFVLAVGCLAFTCVLLATCAAVIVHVVRGGRR